jgi:glycosyltransferase involved in cell wall biosynthesis
MRIAIFSRFPRDPDFPRGGIETVTLTLVQALASFAEIDLHVVTLENGRRDREVTHWRGVTVHRLPGSNLPHMLDITVGPGKWRLRSYLKRLRPDVVHSHEYHGLCIGRLPVPHLYTMHGFDHENIPAQGERLAWLRVPIWRKIEAWGLAHQQHIISITPYVREAIRPFTHARIYDIRNPVSESFFSIQHAEVPGRVFFAGWISPRKNPLTLVEAFAKVIQRGTCASLHIAGEEADHEYTRCVRAAIAKCGISEQTSMLGRISQTAIRRELSEASVFVLPSRQENSPMAIAEAMAAGLPVIATDRCGMPDMIQEAETGYLVNPEDRDALAERITHILTDPQLRQRMGLAARRFAESVFCPDIVARKTVDVYRQMMANRES